MRVRILHQLGAAAVVLGAVATAGATASLAETKFRMNTIAPPHHWFTNKLTAGWIKAVEKATAGRVKIDLTKAPLGPMPRAIDMVGTGIADISAGNHAPIGGRFPLMSILDIPFMGQSPEALSVALWKTYKAHFEKANEHGDDVHLLSLWSSSAAHMFSAKGPMTKPEDYSGLKVIALGATSAKIAQAYGATVVKASVDKWYELMSRGVTDAIISTNTAVFGWRVAPLIKGQLFFPPGLQYSTFFLVINKKKWDGLSKQDRDAMMSVSGETLSRNAGKEFGYQDGVFIDKIKKSDIKIHTASADQIAAMKKKLQFIEDEWIKAAAAKGVDGKAALATFRAAVAAQQK